MGHFFKIQAFLQVCVISNIFLIPFNRTALTSIKDSDRYGNKTTQNEMNCYITDSNLHHVLNFSLISDCVEIK